MKDASSQNFYSTFRDLSFENQILHVKKLKPEEEWAQGFLLRDEWANSLTHGIGLIFSIVGFFLLIEASLREENHWKLASFAIYGASLILLYAASTLYHMVRRPKLKRLFRTIDHCAIYLLIAGSYTPFTMLVLEENWGWTLFSIVWSLAFIGVIFKIFFTHQFKILSTFLYLFMGWLIVIAAKPLMESLHVQGLYWLVAGGLCYTLGVIFYVLDNRRFFHAIWHLFVLSGSLCHYIAILFYL